MAHTMACGTLPLCHSLFAGCENRCVRSGRPRRRSEHTPHTNLDPRIFSEPDRIEALPTPSPPLLQHLHIIKLDQFLRRRRRPLHPTLPTLTCCGTLLAVTGSV